MIEKTPYYRGSLAILWGVVLALLLCRHFFLLPTGTFYKNHDENTYLVRLVEFRDLLAHGYYWPQWCTDFRTGLGSPYFGYYQPGVFYAASLVPTALGPVRQFGCVMLASAILGYVGMWFLVRRHFGAAAGLVAGTLLLTSCYSATDLYIRGDFSEFAATMLLAALISCLDRALAGQERSALIATAICAAALVVMHPCIALFGYGLSLALAAFTAVWHRRRWLWVRPLLALMLGAGMAGFYWLPVLFEWDYVSARGAFSGFFHYSSHFLTLGQIFGSAVTHTVIPVKVGLLATCVLAGAAGVTIWRWRYLAAEQRRLAWFALLAAAGCLFLMHRTSAPIWDAVTLLQRVQFPWRLFSVLGIATAMAGGVLGGLLPPRTRVLMVAVVSVIAPAQMVMNTGVEPVPAGVPQSASQIRDSYFAPDISDDEWLPRGATAGSIDPKRRQPAPGPDTTVTSYRMMQGTLVCEVRTESPSYVILPHYYFPVGWTATLADRPVTIKATEGGLMRIDLPAGSKGTLTVRFGMTPMRKTGLAMSLATAIFVAAWAWCGTFPRVEG